VTKPKPKKTPKAAKPKASKVVKQKKLSVVEQLRADLKKARDELAAHVKRVNAEHRLTNKVKICALSVDRAKSAVSAAKQEHADSVKELTDFLSGEVQTEHPDLKPSPNLPPATDITQTNGVAGEQPTMGPTLSFPPSDQVQPIEEINAPQHFALPKDQRLVTQLTPKELIERVIALIPADIKPLSVKITQTVQPIGEIFYLIRDCFPEVNPTRFFCQQLFSLDEWQQTHETEFGRFIKGMDFSDDTKAKRMTGGPDCGRVVVMNKRMYVLGPEREGLVLICEAAEKAAFEAAQKKETDPAVGKDAASGEGKEPEVLTPPADDEDEGDDDQADAS
jgi:hypothetical protein